MISTVQFKRLLSVNLKVIDNIASCMTSYLDVSIHLLNRLRNYRLPVVPVILQHVTLSFLKTVFLCWNYQLQVGFFFIHQLLNETWNILSTQYFYLEDQAYTFVLTVLV